MATTSNPRHSTVITADAPSTGDTALSPERRKFLGRLSIALGGFAATLVGVPFVGFLLAPLFARTSRVWRPVGKVDDFAVGQTKEVTYDDASPLAWSGATGKTAAWLHREGDQQFRAFSINCSHLGCPVRWEQQAELFLCPCHGGVYFKDGSVAAGPPPRPLTQYAVRINNGNVEVQTAPLPLPGTGTSNQS